MPLSPLSLYGAWSATEPSRIAAEQRVSRAVDEANSKVNGQLPVDSASVASIRKVKSAKADSQDNEVQDDSSRDLTDGRSRNLTRQSGDDEQRELAKLAPKRAQLSPSDEVALFAQSSSSEDTAAAATNIGSVAGEAVAEDGSAVAVEIITAKDQSLSTSAQIFNLNPKAVSTAAAVYAKNHESAYDLLGTVSNLAA